MDMDWASALEHLPHRLVVTDRKGRVLLLSGDIPGVRVGRSFLKLADESDVVTIGRAAKRALRDGTPRKLARVLGVDKEALSIKLIPFVRSGDKPDHLIVMVGDAEPTPVVRNPTPAPAPQRSNAPAAEPTVENDLTQQPTHQGVTPGPAGPRAVAPLPPVPEADELVVVAAGGTLPLARAVASVLHDKVKVRAIPVSRFIDAISKRSEDASPDAIDAVLAPTTRLLFIGDSPYADDARANAIRSGSVTGGSWAIGGLGVRRAAIWPDDPPDGHPGSLIADLQFEMMEVVRKAMPIKRNGRRVPVDPELERASAFLEQPAAMDMTGDLMTQARHHQLVTAIAGFIQEGLVLLLESKPS